MPKTLPFQGKKTFDKIIMIDSDMVFTYESVKQLLESPYDITVAPYILSGDKGISVSLPENPTHFLTLEEIKKYNEPFKIHGGGLGFAISNFEVFEKIPYPWFETKTLVEQDANHDLRGGLLGEDMYFFMKAAHYGFEAYCDPRIKVGHEKSTVLTI